VPADRRHFIEAQLGRVGSNERYQWDNAQTGSSGSKLGHVPVHAGTRTPEDVSRCSKHTRGILLGCRKYALGPPSALESDHKSNTKKPHPLFPSGGATSGRKLRL
jgi:hypothetical protein